MDSRTTSLSLSATRIADPDFTQTASPRVRVPGLGILPQLELKLSEWLLESERDDPPREHARLNKREWGAWLGHGSSILQGSRNYKPQKSSEGRPNKALLLQRTLRRGFFNALR